ncbi:MAG TPA: hypothetical protein PKD00_01865 [Burkholderiales bacterium]|nr:hypothetical protein [Burkholderiales bacterium]
MACRNCRSKRCNCFINIKESSPEKGSCDIDISIESTVQGDNNDFVIQFSFNTTIDLYDITTYLEEGLDIYDHTTTIENNVSITIPNWDDVNAVIEILGYSGSLLSPCFSKLYNVVYHLIPGTTSPNEEVDISELCIDSYEVLFNNTGSSFVIEEGIMTAGPDSIESSSFLVLFVTCNDPESEYILIMLFND